MSKLEVAMQSALRRVVAARSWRLAKEDVEAIVRWSIKTCITHEFYLPQDRRIHTDAMRAALFAGEDMPGTWYFGLARAPGEGRFLLGASNLVERQQPSNAASGEAGPGTMEMFAMQHLFGLGKWIIIVRYTPYKVIAPASLTHDFARYEEWRTIKKIDTALALRSERSRDICRLTDAEIDNLDFWGHATDRFAARGLTLGRGDDGELVVQQSMHKIDEILKGGRFELTKKPTNFRYNPGEGYW